MVKWPNRPEPSFLRFSYIALGSPRMPDLLV